MTNNKQFLNQFLHFSIVLHMQATKRNERPRCESERLRPIEESNTAASTDNVICERKHRKCTEIIAGNGVHARQVVREMYICNFTVNKISVSHWPRLLPSPYGLRFAAATQSHSLYIQTPLEMVKLNGELHRRRRINHFTFRSRQTMRCSFAFAFPRNTRAHNAVVDCL